MPRDSKGGFHLNSQRAHAADRAPKGGAGLTGPNGPSYQSPHSGMGDGETGEDSGPHTTLHDHQDGTYHTEGHDGEHAEHPSFDHAMEHMKSKHGGDMSPHSAEHGMATGDIKDCY